MGWKSAVSTAVQRVAPTDISRVAMKVGKWVVKTEDNSAVTTVEK